MKWQPIETAPRDGTRYLAFDGKYFCVLNWPAGYSQGEWVRDRKGWSGSFKAFEPTHWMPLPKPPKE